MKRNIEIKKKIEFSSMIGEIVNISLENHLTFTGSDCIEGNLVVIGKYKKTKASQLEEDFKYSIPVEITLTDEIDKDSGSVEIKDFYYDLEDDNTLLCSIELIINGIELLKERECDGDPVDEKEIEIPHIENKIQDKIDNNNREEDTSNLDTKQENDDYSVFNINDAKETYGTFVVYMVRENESINTIIEKYQTSLEEIEKYNDIKNISMGSKIIIPIINEKN